MENKVMSPNCNNHSTWIIFVSAPPMTTVLRGNLLIYIHVLNLDLYILMHLVFPLTSLCFPFKSCHNLKKFTSHQIPRLEATFSLIIYWYIPIENYLRICHLWTMEKYKPLITDHILSTHFVLNIYDLKLHYAH